jgi:hypothetical protein
MTRHSHNTISHRFQGRSIYDNRRRSEKRLGVILFVGYAAPGVFLVVSSWYYHTVWLLPPVAVSCLGCLLVWSKLKDMKRTGG